MPTNALFILLWKDEHVHSKTGVLLIQHQNFCFKIIKDINSTKNPPMSNEQKKLSTLLDKSMN